LKVGHFNKPCCFVSGRAEEYDQQDAFHVCWSDGLEAERLLLRTEPVQKGLQRRREAFKPLLFLAGQRQDVAILDHVRRLQVAQVDPDRLLRNLGDGADVAHDAEHEPAAHFLWPAGSDIAANPDVLVSRLTAQVASDRLAFLDDDLNEKRRGASRFAMTMADRNGDLIFLFVAQEFWWNRAHVGRHCCLLGDSYAGARASRTRPGVIGGRRRRTPVAAKTACPIAGAVTAAGAPPAPMERA